MTSVAFEAERWYADKGRRVTGVETLDALGPLEIARVAFEGGGYALYSLVPDDVAWPELLRTADGRFAFSGTTPDGAGRRLAALAREPE